MTFGVSLFDNSLIFHLVTKDERYYFVLGTQASAEWIGNSSGSPSIMYSLEIRRVMISLICVTDDTNELEALGESPQNFYRFNLKNKCACWNGCRSKTLF